MECDLVVSSVQSMFTKQNSDTNFKCEHLSKKLENQKLF